MKNLKCFDENVLDEDILNEKALIKRAQNGDIWARNKMIEMNMPLVKKIASKIVQKTTLSKSDLIQEGVFGLITAIEKFDINMNSKFSTYATFWIKQIMFKAISEQSYAYNIPVYIQETVSRFNKTKQEMEQTENKQVNTSEVAQKMNMSKDKINTFLNCFNRALSIEQGLALSENKELTLAEVIEDEKQNVEKNVLDNELRLEIKFALEKLKEKEKNVIIMRFGLNDTNKQTLEQIGDLYGVTKECIRQIEKRALNKIAQSFSEA